MSSPLCFENPPRLTPDYGAGTVQEFGGLQTYVTGASDSKLAILLIADVYGYEAPNLRKLADKVAAAGFFVLTPDFLYGDPVDVSKPGFDVEAWKKLHNTDKGKEDAKSVIATLKSKGVNSIGVAGFCWGGNVAVKLASSNDIQAAVILHPGPLTIDEIKEVKIPIAILGGETDRASPPEQLKEFGEILSAKSQLASLVKIFPGAAMDGQFVTMLRMNQLLRVLKKLTATCYNGLLSSSSEKTNTSANRIFQYGWGDLYWSKSLRPVPNLQM